MYKFVFSALALIVLAVQLFIFYTIDRCDFFKQLVYLAEDGNLYFVNSYFIALFKKFPEILSASFFCAFIFLFYGVCCTLFQALKSKGTKID